MNPRVGMLFLYIKLYDDSSLVPREPVERFKEELVGALIKRSVEPVASGICRTQEEVATALQQFRHRQVDALITIHLAYSPSLESAPLVAQEGLPVLVWNTTPASTFAPEDDPRQMLFNHGIHGVQDFCNLLRRHHAPFTIVSGHWRNEACIGAVVGWSRGVAAARAFSQARVGVVGGVFPGMADFTMPEAEMTRLGISTVAFTEHTASATGAVEAEMEQDAERFPGTVDAAAHRAATEAGLRVRTWATRDQLSAVTINFLDAGSASGLPAMPFVEACKLMATGVGYAGEGDVLTAAFIGSLLQAGFAASFAEMFCPDWAGNRIFLSHMGEANLACLEATKLIPVPFPFSDAEDTVGLAGRFVPGSAALVNLAPVPADAGHDLTLRIVSVSGAIVAPAGTDRMDGMIRGWFQPAKPVAEVLSEYSRAGGTHHCALVYGEALSWCEGFAAVLGISWRAL